MNAASPLLEAAPNFRDMGGYVASDGRTVRARRLYRSELLLGLGSNDLETLRSLDIGVVCDLRSPAERHRRSCEWPGDQRPRQLALDLDADLSSVQPDKWSRKLRKPDFGAAEAKAEMLENYRRMPSAYARDLHALFAYLSGPDAGPVLVHCAVGKDRTGFVSAMLLSALGVPRQTLFADYELTSQRFPPERMLAERARFLPDIDLDDRVRAALGALVLADPDYLNAALEVLDKHHGGIDAYLEQSCGLTADIRSRLQDELLEA